MNLPDDPQAGRMTWENAVAGPLSGMTCLWQDLDGLHVEPAPAGAPPTSILWAWQGRRLARVRLDGDRAFVAVLETAPGDGAATLPWSADDGRVAASQGRGPDERHDGVRATYEQVIVDGTADGAGPITFVRPVTAASNA